MRSDMKKRVFTFLSILLLGLLILPLINIAIHPDAPKGTWRHKKNLYNADVILQWPNYLLFHLGISTQPEQAVIGRNGWLFLGDKYARSMTVTRTPGSATDFALGQKMGAASQSWETWLKSQGVQVFRVMVGPNKESIYPEYLPEWVNPAAPSMTDKVLAGTGTRQFIDLRPALLAAKNKHAEALYYPTDTHWNTLGAGEAFLAFSRNVAPALPDVRWPQEEDIRVINTTPRAGGDLAAFLRIQRQVTDPDPSTAVAAQPIEVTQYDFDSGKLIQEGGNPLIASQQKPLLVNSKGALNQRKVLWLRDSFGTAMSPLMAATFSQTVQLHWDEALAPGGRFLDLIEMWKPDYVFITVVERDSRSPLFTPPIAPSPTSHRPAG